MQLQELGNNDVVPVALNVDSDADLPNDAPVPPAVQLTIDQVQVGVAHWICRTASATTLEKFDLFALPSVVVIKDGSVVKKFEGEFTLSDDVVPWVKARIAG